MGRALFSRVNVYHGTPVHTVAVCTIVCTYRKYLFAFALKRSRPAKQRSLNGARVANVLYMCGAGGARRAMSDMSYGVK